eukprot:Filipodium_phascolosomae@DN1815_c1_g1_i3.p1
MSPHVLCVDTTALEELDIGGSDLGSDGLQALEEQLSVERLKALKMLKCHRCLFEGPAGGRAFGQLLMKTTALTNLDFGNVELGSSGLEAMVESISAEKLKEMQNL